MSDLVTYDVGDLQVTAPRTWSALARANAVCELQFGHEHSPLATLALLQALHVAPPDAVPDEIENASAAMLRDGWCPGDGIKIRFAGVYRIWTRVPL